MAGGLIPGMLRRTITKSGVTEAKNEMHEQDILDAQSLLSTEAWKRFYLRRLSEKKQKLMVDLATLKSDDISDFKKLQAKIEVLDEIKTIPESTIKTLKARASTG